MSKFDIKINDVLIPSPDEFTSTYADLVTNSGRNAAGVAKFNYVATKVNWDCVWGMLSEANAISIMSMLEGPSKSFITITAKFPGSSEPETRTYYKGDRKFGKQFYVNGEVYYKSLSVSFIQK